MLDQLAVAGVAEEMVGAAKIAGHWLTFGPLLLIAAVPASVMVGLDGAALGRCLVALAIGTPGARRAGGGGGGADRRACRARGRWRGCC